MGKLENNLFYMYSLKILMKVGIYKREAYLKVLFS